MQKMLIFGCSAQAQGDVGAADRLMAGARISLGLSLQRGQGVWEVCISYLGMPLDMGEWMPRSPEPQQGALPKGRSGTQPLMGLQGAGMVIWGVGGVITHSLPPGRRHLQSATCKGFQHVKVDTLSQPEAISSVAVPGRRVGGWLPCRVGDRDPRVASIAPIVRKQGWAGGTGWGTGLGGTRRVRVMWGRAGVTLRCYSSAAAWCTLSRE